MTALGFKKQFAPLVESRAKRQTIRAKAHNHKVGRAIQLYTGMRTNACRKLVDDDPVCISIAPIWIEYGVRNRPPFVHVGDKTLSDDEAGEFAKADGFDDITDFFLFFMPDTPEDQALGFHGYLIEWDWPE